MTTKIRTEFERGTPMSHDQALVALKINELTFKAAPYYEDFQILLGCKKRSRTWLSRIVERMRYSARNGTISQSVPVDWEPIAVKSSKDFCQAAIDLKVDDIFAADETFILFYQQDKFLVPRGTRRVGTLVPAENEKKGVTLMVTASLESSSLLPPFIIDTGKFGADLMKEWQTYIKSTVLFNETHWMTQFVFVIYLEWLFKMFPDKRILLIVDKSTTHDGVLVNEWLAKNHASPSIGKIFVKYILEGMTSVQQVCDIAINKPLKSRIKKSYFDFRHQSLEKANTTDLKGCVLTVPRECLVEMIENAFDDINHENKKRRWIAKAFAMCGQDPWSGDQLFIAHLQSLKATAVYGNNNKPTIKLD